MTDDNDHTPTFDADIYEASIEENNQEGAVLFLEDGTGTLRE